MPKDEMGSTGGVSFTGNWAGLVARLRGATQRLNDAVRLATQQNCVGLVGEIKTGITKGQLLDGSQPPPLHPYTVMQRLAGLSPARQDQMLKALSSGKSAKRLFNHGDLTRAFTYRLSPDGWSGVVGVNRQAKNKDGDSLVNIAAVQFKGKTIRVTDKMRRYLAATGLHLRPSTTHITIPAWDPVTPTFKAYKETALERYRSAVKKSLGIGGE